MATSGLAFPAFNVFPTFACLLSSYLDSGYRDYSGYQVLRINTSSDRAFDLIQNIYHADGYDFWSPPSRINPTDILVPPGKLGTITSLLRIINVPYQAVVKNLQRDVDLERSQTSVRQTETMTWTSYHRLATIHAWEDSLASNYPDLVEVLDIGKSFEGRPLRVIKISTSKTNEKKPAIWIDGGIHAREWISPATVTYMANELIKMTAHGNNTRLVDIFDWYINPNVNPDGYEYTWTVDRMWRKTRSTSSTKDGEPEKRSIFEQIFGCCKGTDPNRNFAHEWGGKGTSKNKCSEIYHGPKAASESEVKAVQNFIYERRDTIKLFLTFHSYSQMLLLPWGYDATRTPDHDELMDVANRAAKRLESVHGTKYQVGPSPELLYPAAGGSEDYAKGVAGIKFAYCFELRDTGTYGFILPARQIIPSGQETFEAVMSMAEDMITYYKLDNSSAVASSTLPASF
ncbi:unnamed protein product [Allacma fusca]|uniref:Peptidase M14 domain-containing protein n=1 Tax=Allacma fusca TaxID=39272 RepID=A0A8J2K6X8_9HEXA|nr:unnamed protein product [Allacma fusca]